MTIKLVIPGPLPSLNEYINANRHHWAVGAGMKKRIDTDLAWIIREQVKCTFERPVQMHYLWVEKNRRRDLDNIVSARKFIQDALVKAGVLRGDGWRHVTGFTDEFAVDPDNPRVEVIIKEQEAGQ